MRFYIFAGISPNIKCSVKERYFETSLLKEALDKFESLTTDIDFVSKYLHAYLIAYMELPERKKSHEYTYISLGNKSVPFIIIQEYKYEDKPTICDVENSLVIETKGFRQEFTNNKAAIIQFYKYYEELKQCSLILRYMRDTGDQLIEDAICIGTSLDMIRNINKNPLKKISISSPMWITSPVSDFERIALAGA